MAVLEGLKLTIENFDEMKLPSSVTVPDFPSDPQCTSNHQVAFDRVVYIERTDYRQVISLIQSWPLFISEWTPIDSRIVSSSYPIPECCRRLYLAHFL